MWIWVCNRLSYLRFANSINLENLDRQTQSSNIVSLVNIPYVHRLQYITFFLWWRPSWIPIDKKKKIVWDHAKLFMYVFGSLKFMVSINFFFHFTIQKCRSYVRSLSCVHRHLGFPIDSKVTRFMKDHPRYSSPKFATSMVQRFHMRII